MQATLDYSKTQIKRETIKVYVPHEDIAKLMYYLHCIGCVLQYDINSIFLDYKNYYRLTEKEKEAVVYLAKLFDPKLLIDAKIFILDSNLLIGELDNEFYKITDEKLRVHANEEITIGGKLVRVLKIMACNMLWLKKNYYDPIENIDNRKKYGPCWCFIKHKKSCIITIIIIVIIAVMNIIYYCFLAKKDSNKDKI